MLCLTSSSVERCLVEHASECWPVPVTHLELDYWGIKKQPSVGSRLPEVTGIPCCRFA